ncbi:hypothetical protein MYX76_07820 [Desulfobacterota bacterium AH_259_B03_O07]|nr:hypothetical protein [Desulfobacterota bacterium AH_259_B03_O07]
MDEYKEIIEELKMKRDELEGRLNRVEKSLRKTHDKDSEEQAIERAHEEVVEGLEEGIRRELDQGFLLVDLKMIDDVS